MIEANGVTKSYGFGESKTDVLKGIDLQISDGDFAVILGASGSGKSTLLNCLSGLERVDGGSIEYDGLNIAELSDKALTKFRKDNIGFIFQQYYLLPDMTVEKNVRMGADLAGNADYEEIIRAVGLKAKAAKIRPRFRAVSSSGYRSPVRLPKSPRFCFWTSRQARSTNRRGGWCWTVHCKAFPDSRICDAVSFSFKRCPGQHKDDCHDAGIRL